MMRAKIFIIIVNWMGLKIILTAADICQ